MGDNGGYLNEILYLWRREIRPGLIHLLLTEHNGQTGEESWSITGTAPPLAALASPDLAQSREGWESDYCKTATRDNQIELRPSPPPPPPPTDKL